MSLEWCGELSARRGASPGLGSSLQFSCSGRSLPQPPTNRQTCEVLNSEDVMHFFRIVLVAAAAAASAAAPGAQTEMSRSAEPLQYQSAFEDYRPFKDEPVASWREMNREVARVGGHAGVLKSDAPATKSAPPLQRPANPSATVPAATPAPSHPAHR